MKVQRFLYGCIVLLMLWCLALTASAETSPGRYKTKTMLNVRQGPGARYEKIGCLDKGEEVVIKATSKNRSTTWGQISYDYKTGYVSMKYVEYVGPVEEETNASSELLSDEELESWLFWRKVKVIAFWIILIVGGLLILAFRKEIIRFLCFIGSFMMVGWLVFWLLFDHGSLGATLGLLLAIFVGTRIILEQYRGENYSNVLEFGYFFFSSPVIFLNKLQHLLCEPWRYVIKSNWIPESIRTGVRIFLNILQVLLYIATTPLRLLNAIIYNIFIRCITEQFDLVVEVLIPSSEAEGSNSFWRWLLMLPWRMVYYPIYHGAVSLLEGIIWTIIDIFIPAITLYHGTDLTAAQSIVCSPKRNSYRKKNSMWTDGTFLSSSSGWGGSGVFFGSRRSTAKGYAYDEWRLGDSNPVMIVCRVSLGPVINYCLAPDNVYYAAGRNGNPRLLSSYGKKHGYTTGEWWNDRGYWEFCLFDYQNRYNHPWRIRPIYVFNFRTGLAQPIKGGTQHWLFDKVIINDIIWSIKKDYIRFLLIAVSELILAIVAWNMLFS